MPHALCKNLLYALIHTNLHSRINVCIKKLSNRIFLIKTHVKCNWIIFIMQTFMWQVVWIYSCSVIVYCTLDAISDERHIQWELCFASLREKKQSFYWISSRLICNRLINALTVRFTFWTFCVKQSDVKWNFWIRMLTMIIIRNPGSV